MDARHLAWCLQQAAAAAAAVAVRQLASRPLLVCRAGYATVF